MYRVYRVYRVYINSNVQRIDLNKINKGITIKGISYKKIKVSFEKKIKNYNWLIFNLCSSLVLINAELSSSNADLSSSNSFFSRSNDS